MKLRVFSWVSVFLRGFHQLQSTKTHYHACLHYRATNILVIWVRSAGERRLTSAPETWGLDKKETNRRYGASLDADGFQEREIITQVHNLVCFVVICSTPQAGIMPLNSGSASGNACKLAYGSFTEEISSKARDVWPTGVCECGITLLLCGTLRVFPHSWGT